MSTTPGVPPGYHRLRRGRMASDNFTQIRNALFRDSRLSAKAMGVFGHISTHRDGYGVTPESIGKHMRDGVSAIKGALRELEECGYLVRSRERNPDGTLGGTMYEITDQPEAVASLPSSEPADGNPPQDLTRGNATPVSDPDKADTRRSEPADGNPPVDNPPVENHPPKNINLQNTRITRTNQAPLIGDADGEQQGDAGWLDEPPNRQPPSQLSPGARFLHRLPDTCRPSTAAITRLAPKVDLLLASGEWTCESLRHRLTRGIDSAFNPAGAVISRIEDLAFPKGTAAPSKPHWCGECDERTRQRENEQGLPYRCPECHPKAVVVDASAS